MNDVELQREYYRKTAARYDEMHGGEGGANTLSFAFVNTVLDYLDCKNVLEIGSGTGIVINALARMRPTIQFTGIEPVEELREQGYQKGLSNVQLINGDGTRLSFANKSFDLVFEFAVLHHIRNPELVVSEMLRVARKGIVICDSNNFGQGSFLSRSLKQLLRSAGLWGLANWVKTRGRGYIMTEGDGISYSYSVFTNLRQIRSQCSRVHIMNISESGENPYRTAGSVAVFGILDRV